MVKVKRTDFALENLIAIGDYIEKDSYVYAERVVNSLFNAVDILKQHPLAGRIVPEFNNNNIRELIHGYNYSVSLRHCEPSGEAIQKNFYCVCV